LTPQGRQKIEENEGNSASVKGGKGNAIQMLMLALFTAFSLCKPTKYMFVCDLPSVRVSVIQFPTFCFEYLATFQLTDTLNFEFLFSGLLCHINHTPCVTGRHIGLPWAQKEILAST